MAGDLMAPPVNDLIANATLIDSVGSTVLGSETTVDATFSDEVGPYLGYNQPSVWYRIEIPGSMTAPELAINIVGETGYFPYGEYVVITGSDPPADTDDVDYDGAYFGDGTESHNHIYDGDRAPLSPGDIVYLYISNWNFDASEGAFSLTVTLQEITAPANDNFANAIDLLSGTHTINGSTLHATNESPFIGEEDVWYKLQGENNPNGGTFEVTGTAADSGTIDTYVGFAIGQLIGIDGDFGTSWTVAPEFYQGPSIYIRVANTNAFSFTYTFTPFDAPLAAISAAAGDEIKSPSAAVTRYPGGAVAIRVGDFVEAGATTGTGEGTPNNDYVTSDQVYTPSFANFLSTSNPTSVSDCIVIDPYEIPLETGINYDVWVLCRTVGIPSTTFGKNYQTFREQPGVQLWGKQDFEASWNSGEAMFVSIEMWKYMILTDLMFTGNDPDEILRIRMLNVDAGTELQIAQITLLPQGPTNADSPWFPWYEVEDFVAWQWTDSYWAHVEWAVLNPYNDIPEISDTRADELGELSVDGGSSRSPNDYVVMRDYQNSDDPDDVEMTTFLEVAGFSYDIIDQDSHMFTLWGADWIEAKTIEDDDFGRTITQFDGKFYPTGGSTDWSNLAGVSPYGYYWLTLPFHLHVDNYWDLGSYFGYTGPSYSLMDGDSLTFAIGGGDTQLVAMIAQLSYGGNADGSPVSGAVPPRLSMEDGIIEAVVSWVGEVDSSIDAEVASVGFRQNGNQAVDYHLCVVLIGKNDGSIYVKLQAQYDDMASYDITSETLFESSYNQGDKIRMKFRRRRYLVDAKVWYDGDTEPSTWDYSGYVPGIQIDSPNPRLYIDYPYDTLDAGYDWQELGFSEIYGGVPYLRNAVSFEEAYPTDNGGQFTRMVFTWDNFKVTYDPDGATDKDAYIKIRDDDQTQTWVPPSSVPSTRHAFSYMGHRGWGYPDESGITHIDEELMGFTTYLWAEEGAGTLVATGSSLHYFRYNRQFGTAIIIGDVSMFWSEGSTYRG